MSHELKSTIRNEKHPRLWGWHTALSGLAALSFLAVLAAFVDWRNVWREVLSCQKGYVLLGALCHYLTYPARGLRWRRCLSHLPIRGDKSLFAWVVFFYNFVDNVVPAKLGDVYAAHMARINFGIGRSEAIGSVVFLRVVDTWVVLSAALLASWALLSTALPNSVLWTLIGGAVIALASTAVLLVFFFLDKSLPHWIPQRLRQWTHSFRKGMWPRSGEMLPIMALTAIIWILEALWVFFLVRGFNLSLTPVEALFLTMVPLLASAFPLTPSGAGVVELTLFSCLRLVGAGATLAGSITVLNRFIDYWLHIASGAMVWLFRHRIGLRTWREATSSYGTESIAKEPKDHRLQIPSQGAP